MIRKQLYSIASILVLCWAGAFADSVLSPTERVRNGVDEVLVVLRDATLDREERQVRIRDIINRGFDFQSMSQSVLATNWKKANPEERRRFVSFFSEYIENTYMTTIEAYTDEQIHYVGEKVRGDRAVVETTIMSAKAEVPVNYKLKLNDGEWFAYDVIIEGVSLVSNYRSTFSAIVKTEGMDGLLTDLQGKIDRYKAEQAKAGRP